MEAPPRPAALEEPEAWSRDNRAAKLVMRALRGQGALVDPYEVTRQIVSFVLHGRARFGPPTTPTGEGGGLVGWWVGWWVGGGV